MPSRKSMDSCPPNDGGKDTLTILDRIRNMWQFANLCQWIYIFGKAAKIDDSLDIEDLEMDCLKPQSELLQDIALALLRLVSSHRGLTAYTLDDQLRKQYLSRAPDQNPFGDKENPLTFAALDIFQKIQVLQTLTQWIMSYSERLREKMDEKDNDQTEWRIEPYGWDSRDRVYYVLDDNRLYRFTEPAAITLNLKTQPVNKRYSGGRRTSRRHRAASSREASSQHLIGTVSRSLPELDNGLGGGKWECISVTAQDLRDFIETLSRTYDENEKVLRKRLEKYLLPILEKHEESMKRKNMQRERELLNLSKLANAKRSSRIADKMERQKQDDEQREKQRQKLETEQVEKREKISQTKSEQEREFRAFSRQRRLKDREARRKRYEEELLHLSEGSRGAQETARISERRVRAEIERKRQALKDIDQEEEDWIFDCSCGLYGHVDDGTHSVSCERCNIWQHSKCVGVSEKEAEQPAFHFICQACRHRIEEQSTTSKSGIKLKVRPSDVTTNALRNKEHLSLASSGEMRALLDENRPTEGQAPGYQDNELRNASDGEQSVEATHIVDTQSPLNHASTVSLRDS